MLQLTINGNEASTCFFRFVHIKRQNHRQNNKVLYTETSITVIQRNHELSEWKNNKHKNTEALNIFSVVVLIQQLNGYVIENLILLPECAESTPSLR